MWPDYIAQISMLFYFFSANFLIPKYPPPCFYVIIQKNSEIFYMKIVPDKKRSKTFSKQELDYVAARAKGMNCVQAAQAAGYSQPNIQGYQVEKRPSIQAALQKEWKRAEKVMDISKKQVLDGMMDAIGQAKLMADPMAQISGWREVAKMCGYYEPQRLQVEVSVSAKRLFSQFETLSDEELLKIAEQDIIEADEFEVLDDDPSIQPSSTTRNVEAE